MDLKKQIEAGKYPGIVKTTLDGVNQLAYLEGKSETSARDYFFYYSGSTPSAVRYKNWKMYYTMTQSGAAGWLEPLTTYHFTLVQNIKRDPFEQCVAHGREVGDELWRCIGRTEHRLHLRLEYPANRPAVVDKRAHVVQDLPAASGPGNLQPLGDS